MINSLAIVGRLKYTTEDYMIINLNSVNNEECEVKCTMSGELSNRVREYCSVNDIIGVKGHLSTDNGNDTLHIVAEKVTFLTSKQVEGGE